jgi:hypothetical protein
MDLRRVAVELTTDGAVTRCRGMASPYDVDATPFLTLA